MQRNGAFEVAEKKSFVLYHDIREPIEQLSMEQRGELFTAILDYSENGTLPAFTGELRMAFAFIRSSLDRDAAAWEAKRVKRAEAGRLGGLAKVANATNAKQKNQLMANQAVNVPVPVPVNVPGSIPDLSAVDPDTTVSPRFERRKA